MAYKGPIIAQRTINLCWEASAHMLWQWKHGKNAEDLYQRRAGEYARMDKGLSENQMDSFYRQLGIRGLASAAGKNVRFALKWSPVIVNSVDQALGHSLVVIDHRPGQYDVINPCGVATMTFDDAGDTGSCTAAITQLPQEQIDKELGHYIWYW